MAQNRKISQLPSWTPTTSDVGVMVQGGVTKQYSLNATPVSATIQAAIDAGTGAVDSVNGQTGVVVLTTADIADSTNKRYVTDANLTVIGNTSGTNTGDNATNTQYSGLATSKQDTLVSGTNIKTINSTSLLGSGNIDTTQTTITGNAWTATALQTARTIGTITGDATSAGSSFDGTANNTNSITVTKINGTSLAGLGTGILKNTTGTWVPSIALNSDLPVMTATVWGAVPTPPNNTTTFLRWDGTFATPSGGGTVTSVSVASANGLAGTVANATTTPAITLSTSITGVLKGNWTAISAATSGTDYVVPSGSVATLTTPRAIYGNNFDGSAALTQVIASTYGGTGNGFAKLSWPATTEKTFTLPNASATILTDNSVVTVAQWGTGVATHTTAYGLLAAGTTATGAEQTLATGTSGQYLRSGGSGALPSWSTATIPATAWTSWKILKSDGTNFVSSTETYAAPWTSGNILTSDGTNWTSAAPAAATITPTMKYCTTFETAGRFEVSNTNGGTSVFNGNNEGVFIVTSATSAAATKVNWKLNQSANAKLYVGSPVFSANLYMYTLNATLNSGSAFFGIGTPTVSGSGHTFTDSHIGFKIIKTGGATTLYATQADGTETASSALTTLANDDCLDLILKVNGTSSVDYYWRKNGSALSAATNLTTHIPTANASYLQYSISNDSTARDFSMIVTGSSYER